MNSTRRLLVATDTASAETQTDLKDARIEMKPTVTIDVRHVACPPGLWVIIPPMRNGNVGDVVEVLTTDPKDKDDIARWLQKTGNELLYIVQEKGYERIVVRKTK